MRNRIGPRLRELREAQQVSLEALAGAAGITPQQLARIERGESSPVYWVVANLAGQLGVTLRELAAIEHDPSAPPTSPAATLIDERDVDPKRQAARLEARERYAAFNFTRRERDIADLLLAGVTKTLDIGAALDLQEQTVKNMLTGMFQKSRVNDRTQLVLRLFDMY